MSDSVITRIRSVLLLGVAAAAIAFLLAVTLSAVRDVAAGPSVSDRFWQTTYVQGVSQFHFTSLEEMVLAPQTELIVLGSFESVSTSRSWVAVEGIGDDGVASYVKAKVRVDRTLVGSTPTPGVVEVELFIPNPKLVGEALANVPPESSVLFLTTVDDVDGPLYRLVSGQGYVRDQGHAEPPVFVEDEWLENLRGSDFDSFVDQVAGLGRSRSNP